MSKTETTCFFLHCKNPVTERNKIHYIFPPCLDHTIEADEKFKKLIEKKGSDYTKWKYKT